MRADQPPEYRVERFKRTFTEREHGYLPVEREREFQRLVRISYGWLGSHTEVLGVEEIPQHVLISLGCFGDTGGWKSRFAEYIS
jgi:hypothetical protein